MIAIPTARISIADTKPAASRLGGDRDRGSSEGGVGAVEQVRRAAERGDHRTKPLSCAAAPRARRRRRRGRSATSANSTAEDEQLGGKRERHLDQARVGRAARQVVDRLPHLDGVAGGAAEDLVHVGQQRRSSASRSRRRPRRSPSRAHARRRATVRNAPEPTLTSITSESSPAASFFDRIDAMISGIDSTVPVASRIAYRRRSAGASRAVWPTIAQPARPPPSGAGQARGRRRTRGSTRACRACRPCVRGRAGDHRDGAAARRHDRREQQADLVADAAGRVLVEHRAGPASVQSSTSPDRVIAPVSATRSPTLIPATRSPSPGRRPGRRSRCRR